MDFKDHGDWEHYIPEPWPKHLSNHRSIMFARRIGDGIDWYKFQRTQLQTETSFTIKMTLLKIGGHWQVQATYRDASYIFPAAHKLIEIDLDGDHERFRRMRFDLERGTFYDPAPLPVPRTDLLIELHRNGLLEAWDKLLGSSDVQFRLALSAERPLTEEDEGVRTVARKLGWDDAQLKRLFDDARQQVRNHYHG